MSDSKPQSERHLIVIEQGDRWRKACWRFGPAWFADRALVVHAVGPVEALSHIQRHRGGIVLWEASPQRLVDVSREIAKLAAPRDAWLQCLAIETVSREQTSMLQQLGISGFVRHPEELPELERMIRGHFARTARLLH